MITQREFRLARQQFLNELRAAQKRFTDDLSPLFPDSRAELEAYHNAEYQLQERHTALYGLRFEDENAPITAIWDNYLRHIKKRKVPKRSLNAPVVAKAKARRQLILDAAVDCIKHAKQITMADICDKVEVGRNRIYEHFASKDDLIDQAYTKLFASLLE